MGRNGELFNYFILTGSFITRMLWIENLSFLRGYLYKGLIFPFVNILFAQNISSYDNNYLKPTPYNLKQIIYMAVTKQ